MAIWNWILQKCFKFTGNTLYDSNILSMAGACIEFGQMSQTRYQDS